MNEFTAGSAFITHGSAGSESAGPSLSNKQGSKCGEIRVVEVMRPHT